MTEFSRIRTFIQGYADNIAEVLGLDVTILDEQGIRVSGTGDYRDLIGLPAPEGSFFRMILQTGQPGIIYDMKKNESQCMNCKFLLQCRELATIGFPVHKREKTVGVIGLIGFLPEQKEKMLQHSEKLMTFLHHTSALIVHKLLELEEERRQGCNIQEELPYDPAQAVYFAQLIGAETGLQEVIRKAKKVKDSLSTVLIRGESGTGKELLARAIHSEGNRAAHPFIAVNCAAIPETLLESELFGYEGGAFTGSRREGKPGKFELAHKGTIFLDEVGDIPLSLQPKLLRVLQERTVDRVGSVKPVAVDVRVIAATHRVLESMVREGAFREDLYYRLNVIPLRLQPLRERRADIPLYIHHFLNKYGALLQKGRIEVDLDVMERLKGYDWPGNIRQLENAIEYMVNMAEDTVIGAGDLPEYLAQLELPAVSEQTGGEAASGSLEDMVAMYERDILQQYFRSPKWGGDKTRIAEELQISLSTLYRKLEKHRLI
ncbi:sigma 54-interacting transcriptional regulator [Brevibacillus borstelensis]|jgi:Nif-specific regulatory protein|uniref:sigma-54 interaction domain-containing protein n=1 Tax=Brevibacillus borstelensis TaxID=45462 RepID=UPI00148FCE99|nr:sigma 54-interacting transcriptional regulator [Brevibacillus borstelensis]MCC0563106.1 sigma 54-interacting transcriptional regulator [Brevibacillus borstelensis]MCM3558467.1 sigma 54-interacting transcriptional regulator [Brevibacillus borstelensis]MCM3590431.1 sigma 54-interacting transcriptional regulator [Brevibacillus borstelensis]MED1875750.1 sigma 54-interacting transcriptional regulator [Brevibacillus borstelensis]NOU57822.1 sigma 54-interacting transcriptional regulator [Brevibaci